MTEQTALWNPEEPLDTSQLDALLGNPMLTTAEVNALIADAHTNGWLR